MARIRSLKPDHRTHLKIGVLSDREYRLWVSMILEADDDGRLVAESGQLRAQTWPYGKVTTAQTEEAIQKIAALGRIRLYEVRGVRYAYFPAWKDHQHPKYPVASKLPPPSPDVNFPQTSPSVPPALPKAFPTRGVESRGVESRGVGLRRAESRGEGFRERGFTPTVEPRSRPADGRPS
jgi:hypothetical protein